MKENVGTKQNGKSWAPSKTKFRLNNLIYHVIVNYLGLILGRRADPKTAKIVYEEEYYSLQYNSESPKESFPINSNILRRANLVKPLGAPLILASPVKEAEVLDMQIVYCLLRGAPGVTGVPPPCIFNARTVATRTIALGTVKAPVTPKSSAVTGSPERLKATTIRPNLCFMSSKLLAKAKTAIISLATEMEKEAGLERPFSVGL
uniref:Uncharacterized protein n=1 Tax=Glossina brevipalpis TaxID=37001 RepID=A0A1A9WGX7_9MUSC